MRKFFSIAALSAFTLLLAGCGGDSFSGKSSSGGTTTGGTVASLSVSSSLATIPPDGTTTADITVIAKDANSAVVSGVAVAITASAGTVTVTQATTDSSGKATATLVVPTTATPGSSLTITATSGTVTGTAAVSVAKSQTTVSLLTSLPSIPSDGSKAATITAYVRDTNNNFVSGQMVGFQASSGGLMVTQATTDANGAATATLSSAGDPTNRTITVTAQVAGSSAAPATLGVGVFGTKLTVSGPTTLIQGASGTYTTSLTDAGGNGIANQAVTITSAAGNTLTPATFTTDSTGQKTFTLTATAAGKDTITVAGAGLTATQTVAVSNQSFAFTAPTTGLKVNIGTATPVSLTWTSGGTPQVGKTVSFSATRGTLSAGSMATDGTGTAAVTISSTQSGPSVITATSTDSLGQPVTAQTNLDFLAVTPTQIKAQASPATIATQGSSTITVTVRDATNNLVEGKQVNFTIAQDSTGGSLSVSSATTDVTGQAATVYTASTATSASNGVVISATVAGTSINPATASLTVAGQTVFLSLGTGNKIIPLPVGSTAPTQYEIPYSVQAVDNAGHGVNNVPIALTVTSLVYGKGKWVSGTPWTQQDSISSSDPDHYTLSGIAGCKSEDVDHNGILTSANDYNGNGHLDPGLVAATDVSSVTTANGGTASFNIIYPEDHALWVGVRLTATATVAGTQSSTYTDFWLPILATDIATPTVTPPGEFSPYGLASTCLDPT